MTHIFSSWQSNYCARLFALGKFAVDKMCFKGHKATLNGLAGWP
jgi:hypothetical protein